MAFSSEIYNRFYTLLPPSLANQVLHAVENGAQAASGLVVPTLTASDEGAASANATELNAAIAEAMETGATVWLPPGLYYYNETLAAEGANISADRGLRMVGASACMNNIQYSVPASPNSATLLVYTAKDGSPAMRLRYMRVVLDGFALVGHLGSWEETIAAGGAGTGNGRGLDMYLVINSEIRNFAVMGFDDAGIYADECYYNELHTVKSMWNLAGYEGFNDNATSLYSCQFDLNQYGAVNPQHCVGTTFQSNFQHGVLISKDYLRAAFHNCYWEHNGQSDTDEFAHVWAQTSTDRTAAAIFSGTVSLSGSATTRNNRFTAVGGNFATVDFSGYPVLVLAPKAGGGTWELGSLIENAVVLDNTGLGTKLLDRDWNNKSDIHFRGHNSYTAGVATIAADATSVAVDHGWNRTLQSSQLVVYPYTSLGSANHWYVANFGGGGGTQFAIVLDTEPEAPVSFGWRVLQPMT